MEKMQDHDRKGLAAIVESLHTTLNEIYALDSSWKDLGEWPDDVNGSTLHPAAAPEEIAAAEERFGHKFPPSYKEFLQLHGAWQHFWGDYTLIGVAPPGTEAAQDEIREYVEEQVSDLQRKLGNNFSVEAVAEWENKEKRFMYLANQLVIGTDFGGALWVYDTGTRREDGEMTLTLWDISYGAQEPEFNNFHEFLEYILSEVTLRLSQIKEQYERGETGDEDDEDEEW